MNRKANDAQQRAIDARAPLITVSAGAGTGKTWTLASRYISLLKEGVALDDILTLTFTEKAAQEMRERIEGMMRADEALEGAVSRFDEAYISTLHSFAWASLRESGLSLDLDPASTIIAPPQTDEFRALFARELDEGKFPEFNEILSKFSPSQIAALASDCEDVHAAMGRTRGDFLALQIPQNCEQYRAEWEALMQVCALGWRRFEDMRKNGALLSFTDLIRFAASPKGSKKFAQIMIDEFQDTDPLQEKMARSFAQSGSSVFVVGDPKQSIYRFRNSDLSIFDRYTAESREPGNLYVNMNQSFRMRSELYERVNSLFGDIWAQGLGQNFPHLEYEELSGVENKPRERETLPAWGAILEHKVIPINDSRVALLKKLVSILKKFRQDIEWRDCAILTPTRTSWGLIEKVFSDAGVPLIIESGTSWLSHGEVSDLINMLRALAFPDDELANEGWRRSIFAPRDEGDAQELREIAQIKGAGGVIAYFIDNLGWLKNLSETRRNRALANVRHAAQLVGEYERSLYKSLQGCAEWLALALKNDKKIDEPRISSEENAVRLFTVHSSKGLEFPLVVVFGTEATPRKRQGESLFVSKHFGVVSSKHEDLKKLHDALESEAITEEWQRLFYVATTRAKDCVIFCGIKDAAKGAPQGSWLAYLEKAGELNVL